MLQIVSLMLLLGECQRKERAFIFFNAVGLLSRRRVRDRGPAVPCLRRLLSVGSPAPPPAQPPLANGDEPKWRWTGNGPGLIRVAQQSGQRGICLEGPFVSRSTEFFTSTVLAQMGIRLRLARQISGLAFMLPVPPFPADLNLFVGFTTLVTSLCTAGQA